MSLEKFCYMKRIVQFSVLVCFFIGFNLSCSTSEQDGAGGKLPVPDYAQSEMWYRSLEGAANKAVDVFYITPTCIWDWKDQSGQTIHYMDVTNSAQRSLVDGSNALAYALFEKSCNFYSPYYRQITLESWMEGEGVIAERFPRAMADVRQAFTHYLEQENNGRPFFLAGFSQGAKCVVELLKTLKPEVAERLVAAYVIGYRVTETDTATCRNIIPARSADDTGVTICYNSVESAASICPVLSPSVCCINPVSWTCDTVAATTWDSVSVRVDPVNEVLLVKGLDSDRYYLPSLGNLFKKGNYHLLELELYKESLKANVALRQEKFLERRQ